MRKVVEDFEEPSRGPNPVMLHKQRLECGHVVYARHITSRAELLGVVLRGLADKKRPQMRRCHACAKNLPRIREQYGQWECWLGRKEIKTNLTETAAKRWLKEQTAPTPTPPI